MYAYKPPRINRAHIVMPVMFILICAVCIAAPNISTLLPPSVMQFAAVLSAAISVHIISRYSLTLYVYTADDEKKQLLIHKTVGKKSTLVASIDYSDIKHTDRKVKGYSTNKKYSKTYKIYNFVFNMFPQDAYCLVCDVEGNNIAVIIEADEILLSHLGYKEESE